MRSIQSCMVSRFITFLTILGMVSLARVSADQTVNQSSEAFEGASITYQTERTERGVVSRQLSEAEGKRLRIRTGVDLSLNSVAPSQQQLNWFTLAATPQLDAAPEAKAAVLRALAKWEGAFESLPPLTVRVDFGATLFGGQFSSPGTIVTTTIQTLGTFYPNLGEQLERTSFNSRQRAIYEALPLESLPSEVNSIQANAQFVNLPVTLSRIIQPILSRTNDLLSIGFNSANKFDFDPSDGIDADKLDFEALMLREVGRALGFTSSVGSVEVQFDKQPVAFPQAESIWDVFRFRDRASLAAFGTARRPQLSGGEQFFFAGGEPLALSTGRPDGRGGDGRPSGHWKDDELTGQYLGIMDPTYAPGERGGITANDLFALDYFGHSVIPRTPVIEVLSNDDNSREETLSLGGALVVNRFQPARFPCRLQSVRLQLPDGGASPVGKSLRVVVFADTRRSGRPPVSPSLLLDRSVTISAVPENRLLELMLPNGPEIEAGDIYIGWQVPAAVLLGGDANVEQQHSFISTDNGASFQPLRGAGQQPVNLIARAVVQETFGDLPIPRISSLSPATIEPGAGGFKLFVTGHHFTGNGKDGFNDTSVVRWNGQDRATEFINGSLLIADIEAADVAPAGTARITVFTKTEFQETAESAPFDLAIVAARPSPSLTRLEPAGGQQGSDGLTVKILGRNFTPASVVTWNGSARQPEFINSTELALPLSKADLAEAANIEIGVRTPEPGGGASSKAVFPIAPCRYSLSVVNNLLAINGGPQGIFVTTNNYCRWTAGSDAPWITFPGTNSGMGRGFLRYDVADNYVAAGRAGTVTVGDAKISVRQTGYARTVSAASFTATVAPNSIASVFSLGLGSSTNIASTAPLPTKLGGLEVKVRSATGVERLAPLFFTSPEQINFLIPAGTNAGTATLFINGTLNYGTVQIAPVAPGFFTANAGGQGLAAAVALRIKPDGTQRYEPVVEFDPVQNRIVARPIDLGVEGDQVFLLLFGTGIRGRNALSAVGVKIGGLDGEVTFAGAQTDFVGMDQVNVLLPAALRGRGEVEINCTVSGKAANPVTVVIK